MTSSHDATNTESAAAPSEDACACATARHVARLLTHLYDRSLQNVGIEAPQFALLVVLHTQRPNSQAAIGRHCAMDKTTVSRNLKLLERKGWIRSKKARDRREPQFPLTPAGRKRLAAGWPEWRTAQAQLRAVMTDEEWAAMFQMFRTLTNAAQTALNNVAAVRAGQSGRRPTG